jgi:hypothetical protein
MLEPLEARTFLSGSAVYTYTPSPGQTEWTTDQYVTDWVLQGQVFQLKVAWIFCLRWARMRAVETCGCFLL